MGLKKSPRFLVLTIGYAFLLQVAYLAALVLRFEGNVPPRFWHGYLVAAPFFTVLSLAGFFLAGLYHGLWRYASTVTLFQVFKGVTLSAMAMVVVTLFAPSPLFPHSLIVMVWVWELVLLGGARFAWRLSRERILGPTPLRAGRAIVVGAGHTGVHLIQEMRRAPEGLETLQPVGFIDDDPRLTGHQVEGVKVLGTIADLPRVLAEQHIEIVIVSDAAMPAKVVREIARFCAEAGVRVKTLPGLLAEVRALVGERRVTVVFDRGGWSPAMFQKILAEGFDILTYRKGRFRHVPRRAFQEHTGLIDGRKIAYRLADQGIRLLAGKLRLRQVTRLSEDGTHQTPVVTSRRDLSALEVAFRMFERWKQENFFKYLRDEYAIDTLVDYRVEPDDPERDVPNPERQKLDAELKAARAVVARLSAQYGLEAMINVEQVRPTMRGFKIANAKKTREVYATLKRVVALQERRARTPTRIPVQDVVGPEEVVKLAVERKHLTNLVKMVAYQAESDLARILAPHYPRAEDEGRTLIGSALASAADIEVTENELYVRLAPLSSPHRSKAIAAVCDELNRAAVRFPGTRLTLRYAVAEHPNRRKPDIRDTP